MEYLIALIFAAGICGLVGMAVGDLAGKKNGPVGFVLGALLGPVGWIIVAVLPSAGGDPKAAAPAAAPADEATRKRIAALEAELKMLQGPKAVAGKTSVPPADDDGGIPTYKLD